MTNEGTILIIDDEIQIRRLLDITLSANEYKISEASTGKEGLALAASLQPVLIILDLGLPDADGLDILKKLREWYHKPIIILSVRNSEVDIVKALDNGANDYLTKPFSMEELLLRMHAILRRTEDQIKVSEQENIFTIGQYHFDYDRQILSIKGIEHKLTSKEAGLLKLLCNNANNVLERSVALNKIWNDDSYFNARSMDVYIVKLRKYLKEDPSVELINVHGIGFKLIMNKSN